MKIGLAKLSTRELAVLSEQIIRATKASQAEEAKNSVFLRELDEVYTEYAEVITKATYSGKGVSVAQINKNRMLSLRAFKTIIEGFSKVEATPQFEDAKRIQELLNSYGTAFDRLGYAEQTAVINRLLKDLDTPAFLVKLQKMSLEPLFNLLKQQQELFKKVYEEQAEANTELRKIKSASNMRREMEKALKRFLDYTTLMMNNPAWQPLYYLLNEYVKAGKRMINSKEDKQSASEK